MGIQSIIDFLRKIKTGKDDYKGNPFLEAAVFTSNEMLGGKLTDAGMMWESYEHNKDNLEFILITCGLDSLKDYYWSAGEDDSVINEEKLLNLIESWLMIEEC